MDAGGPENDAPAEGAGASVYEEAVRLYGMAVDEAKRPPPVDDAALGELLVALGEAQARSGADPEAKATMLRAAELARAAGLPELLARAAVGYGGRFIWPRAFSDEHLVPLLEDALAAVGEADSPIRAQLLARLATALRGEPSHERRERLGEESIEVARRLEGPATLAYALVAADAGLAGRYPPPRWLEIADEIIELAVGIGDDERLFDGHEHAVWPAAADEFFSPLMHSCIRAHVCAVVGRASEAQRILEDLTDRDLANWHRDEEWLLNVSVLAEACALLAASSRAPRLYELLLPHAGLNAVATGDCLTIGSVDRPLGMLATLMGRYGDAAEHFEQALAMNGRMGAEPWIAHTEEEYARMLTTRRRDGDAARALELAGRAHERYVRLGMETFAADAAGLKRTLE